jgi:hypothetical protein
LPRRRRKNYETIGAIEALIVQNRSVLFFAATIVAPKPRIGSPVAATV